MSSKARKSIQDDILIVNLITYYFKLAALVLAIWFAGYVAFSPSWLLLALVLFVWKFRYMEKRKIAVEMAQESSLNEKSAVLARVEELPAWVIFPDVERAEWFNKIIGQVWPFVADYVHDVITTSVEQSIRGYLPTSLQASFKFSNVDIGDIPPRIGGVKVYTEYVKRDEIIIDVEIIYSSDAEITLKLKGIYAGIKDITLNGTMRIIMRPLIPKIPMVGGISLFFLNPPTIDFNLTSLANAFDIPGLSDLLHSIVDEQVAGLMVLPNRLAFSLADNLKLARLLYPLPQGVLRVEAVEAKDLVSADITLLGRGKSDPYTILRVGSQEFKTATINNTLTPRWNEVFQFIVDEQTGQFLLCEVKDNDPGNDDSLGSVKVDIDSILQSKEMDTWLPLENIKSGMIHLKLKWLYLVPDRLELEKALEEYELQGKLDSEYTSLLSIHLDSARDLPMTKKTMNEPTPFVILSIGQTKQESCDKANTTNPRWEQHFRMFLHNPHVQELNVQVMDRKTQNSLGHAEIPLKNLLMATDLTLDQRFDLKDSGISSQIYLRLCLRVMSANPKPEFLSTSESVEDPAKSDEGDENSNHPGTEIGDGDAKPIVENAEIAVDATIAESEMRTKNLTSSNEGTYKLGRIQLTIRYSEQRRVLIVAVHKCVSLPGLDADHLADPYIKMYLLPDRSSGAKRRTQTIKHNLNPVFDVTFEYQLVPDEIPRRSLEIVVKNKNSFFSTAKEFMGRLVLQLSALDLAVATTQWYDLEPEEVRSTMVSSV